MKKVTVILIGLFLMTFAFTSVNAQTPVLSPAATTTATIITPLSILKNTDLNFGNIVASVAGGTVTVATDNGRTKTGTVTLPTVTPGTVTAAKFTVSGLDGASYSIVVPADFTVVSGANNMGVSAFVTDPTPTGVLTGGSQELFVGATVTVGPNQAAGTYTNTTGLVVTVAYN